ncbi:DNA primase [bacterium]|nr:DNA primase [bacterium]
MNAVDEVKGRLNIEDVIGEYVTLKRAGRNFKGLSPFSHEKTASFVVSPEKQIWKDFSSGKGGSMFDFVMEVEGLDFKGALELLARKAGVDLDEYQNKSNRKGPNKERLYTLLELSAKFYQVQFSKNQEALEYVLKNRNYSKQTALEWRIGYSPNNGTAMIDFAKSKNYTDQEIQQAGLSSFNYKNQPVDMFRGRLMIPLQDPQGRVIGFTARQLDNNANAPKYINTPQTILYDKSRHIYGLHNAKESIRKNKYVVIVEGNLDVIASHQAGVKQVVATAGTALTEPLLKTLSRFTGDIRLSFDADRAGLAATERAIPIASKVKVSLSIVEIPEGKDPDELIKKDPKLWVNAIDSQKYALDWLISLYEKQLDLDSAVGKKQYSDVLLPVIRSLGDAVEKDHYLKLISKKINISQDALNEKLSKTQSMTMPVSMRKIKTPTPQIDKRQIENQKIEDNFICLVLMRKTLRNFTNIVEPEMLSNDNARQLLVFIKYNTDFDAKDAKDIVENLRDYVKIESLLYEVTYQDLELNELHDEAARLQARLVERYVKTQKAKLIQELNNASEQTSRDLLTKVKEYDKLLNQVKGA